MLKINEEGLVPITPPRASASAMRDALSGCPLRGLLDKMYETGQRYGWNVLGSGLHLAIEKVALDDLDLDQAKDVAHEYIWDTIQKWGEAGHAVRYSNGRALDTLEDDVDSMLVDWFHDVHPDSSDRHFTYEPYDWPFQPEVELSRPGFHTSIDAVFYPKTSGEGVGLADWKTGTSKKADPIQMWTYQWAWGEFRNGGVQDAWFHHLAHGEIQPIEDYPGDEYVAHLAEYTLYTQENMTLRMQAKPHWVCGRADLCPHKETRCPAYGGSLQQIKDDAKLLVIDSPKEASNGKA